MKIKEKQFWIKIGKNVASGLECFMAFLFFYLVVALYGAVIPVGELHENGDIDIYVRSNGIHTDLCMPVHTKVINWNTFISTEPYGESGQQEFIAIGWGDKGFFLNTPTWAELKVSTALNAAFLPSPTAMHVMYCQEPKGKDHKNGYTQIKVHLTKKQYKQLIKYVKSTFRKSNGKVDLIANKGYSEADNFYEANDSYHMYRTCNRWTNCALKAANVRTGLFALFPNGILSHLE
ncbi:MAG: TIGR02117 family protein [Crocinitomicaceae bacterium]|nr:TIGR02117 family protein [Crocinitomicaceae bacterium]